MMRRNLSRMKQNYRREKRVDKVLRKRGGQFVVVAALLISIITLSIALSIHRLSLQRLHLRYEPVEEFVMGLTSDLDRCLTHALHRASKEYYESGNLTLATNEGLNFVSNWTDSVITSYSPLGLRVGGDISFHFDWSEKVGQSSVYATNLKLDIESYGFKGWECRSGKSVLLNITNNYTDVTWLSEEGSPSNGTSLVFKLLQGKEEYLSPIPNLTNESVRVWVSLRSNTTVTGSVKELRYLGTGFYNITFTPRMNNNTGGLKLLVITPRDHIYVAASLPYQDIYITLRSQEATSPEPTDLGLIKIGNKNYEPREEPYPIDPTPPNGSYLIRYEPEDDYIFLNWTTTGQVYIKESEFGDSVVIMGNGTITAFYYKITFDNKKHQVSFSSREEDGTTENLGIISLNGTLYHLSKPNERKDNVKEGNYTLEYIPETGYKFSKWTSEDGVYISNPDSPYTEVKIYDKCEITAWYYKDFEIQLRSKSFEDSGPENLGSITFDGETYKLPNSTKKLKNDYPAEYNPHNSSYGFLFWEGTSSTVIPLDPWNITTTVKVIGSGTLTAIYNANSTPPHISQPWGTLYVYGEEGKVVGIIAPEYLIDDHSSHLASRASTGLYKQEMVLESPTTPWNITLGDYVDIYLYIRPNPPGRAKNMTVELGYNTTINNNIKYTQIGSVEIGPINEEKYYQPPELRINDTSGITIPEGSIIIMKVTIEFEDEHGTFFIYFGPAYPRSKIELCPTE
ncbi:MAG: hypothetical protein QXH17_08750 [Candidatus Bathyarchaeia archaeon]